jgi:organic radical activating enzyme
MCVEGRKLVLFITGLCTQRCFYCPVSEKKFGHDVVFANEWQIQDPANPMEMFQEAELTQAKGAGITGGDPLVKLDRCVQYIKLLKDKYGKQFHIHLYTPPKLVTKEALQKLYDAGLDEIRFHPNLKDDKDWHKWFKCSDIDPDILPSEVVNQARKNGYAFLFRYRILHRPVKTIKLILRFSRFMKFSNVVKLIASPFRKRTLTRKPELPARMIEQGLEKPVRVTT